MKLRLLEASTQLPVSVADIKEYVRQDSDRDDHLLSGLIQTATTWVEEATSKTLLKKKWLYQNKNTLLRLPRGPIIDVEEVKVGHKTLSKKDYRVIDQGGSAKIEMPFSWHQKTVSITYTAGFGEKVEDIPETLRHAIKSTVAYIYDNRYSLPTSKTHAFHNMQPWIHYHRTAMI